MYGCPKAAQHQQQRTLTAEVQVPLRDQGCHELGVAVAEGIEETGDGVIGAQGLHLRLVEHSLWGGGGCFVGWGGVGWRQGGAGQGGVEQGGAQHQPQDSS